jgi:sugar lactone lactonase YvrE
MKCPVQRTASALIPDEPFAYVRTISKNLPQLPFHHFVPGRARKLLAGPAILLLAAACAQAQFGAQPAGTATGSQGITVTASVAGTVNSVEILTMGAPAGDYSAGTGTSNCASATLSQGQTCTVAVRFTPSTPGLRMGAVVLLGAPSGGSAPPVLGTAYLSGTGTGGLGVLAAGNLLPVAGQFGLYTSVGDGLPATQAQLYLPGGVAVDGAGNLYIADSLHNRIRMVCASATSSTIYGTSCTGAGIITTIAGNGNPSYTGDGGPAASATLNDPGDVALDGAGNLYIADSGNNAIRKIDAATGVMTTIAGNGTVCGASSDAVGDGCPATQATLKQPQGVTLDAAANLYIADTNNHRIREVSAATGVITTIAGNGFASGNGAGAYNGDGILAVNAELNFPYAVAFDAAGDMYIPDSANNRVREVTAVGGAITAASMIATIAGTGNAAATACGAAPVAANQATVWSPEGVAVDAAGNVYIAETQNAAIRKVSAATGLISTLDQNSCGIFYFAGSFQTKQLYGPVGLSLDGNGNLYVADTLNMVVREIQGNFAALDFVTPVRQGSTSATQNETVENDGNASLDLASIVPATNAAVDPTVANSCTAGAALTVNAQCTVGAVFAPAATPTLPANQAETPSIDVNEDSQPGVAASNSPLDIELVGTAEPVNSTTTTLASNPNPSGFGQSVTFSVTVTTGAGTGNLTGTVSIADTFGGTTATLVSGLNLDASGAATFSTTALGVGQHSLVAAYGGDTQHFASTSAPALIQTVLEATSTSLTSTANPSAVGQSVTFTATVSASGGGVAPDGTVSFIDGSTILATLAINTSGVAQYATATLAAGVHQITAVYNGDAARQILGSTSAALNQDVQAPTTATLTSSFNPSYYGNAVTFTATIPPTGAAAPTGTVTFLDGATSIGTATLAGNPGVAAFTTAALSVGTHTITVMYPGDSFNGPSSSSPLSQVVNSAQTSTAVAAAPSPGIAGGLETITATLKVTAGASTPTGTVTFTSGATQLGSAPVNAGTATITPALGPGTYQIIATYGGDANDTGSTSAAFPLTVNQAATQTALTVAPNPALVQQPITFTGKVTGNGGTPTGSVNFLANGNIIGAGSVNASGTATFNTSALAAGTYSITAAYTGDANDAASTSGATSLTVSLATTTTTVTVTPNPALVGSAVTITAKVAGNGGTPTGTVNFIANGNTLAAASLSGGTASFITPALAPGTYSITASYLGDAADSPSTSSPVSEVVGLIPTTTSLGTSVTTGPTPQVILVATVLNSGSGVLPTGTVTFLSGATQIGSATLDAGGVATLTPNLNAGVNYSIVAVYSGDANHSSSTSPAVNVSGTPTLFSLGLSPSSITMATSQNAAVTVTLTSNGNFADTVGLGCASLPAGVSCHFSNPSVKLTAGSSTSVQLTVDTNNPLSGGSSAMNTRSRSAKFSLAGLFLPLSFGFGLFMWRFRRRNSRFVTMAMALALSSALILASGCSSFSINTAAPGNYTIQVTGTGAGTNAQQYQNLSLNITK